MLTANQLVLYLAQCQKDASPQFIEGMLATAKGIDALLHDDRAATDYENVDRAIVATLANLMHICDANGSALRDLMERAQEMYENDLPGTMP